MKVKNDIESDREPEYRNVGAVKCDMCPRIVECIRITSNENKGFIGARSMVLCQTCIARSMGKLTKDKKKKKGD